MFNIKRVRLKLFAMNFTRYSGVADEEQKKKVLGSNCLFKLSKWGNLKKSLENPVLELRFFLLVECSNISYCCYNF